MLHLYTSLDKVPKRLVPVDDPEITFSSGFTPDIQSRQDLLDNEHSIEAIRLIDGSKKLDRDIIETKFGKTVIGNLSTGCKSALIILNCPDRLVSNLEMGDNVLPVIIELANKYNIDGHVLLRLPEVQATTRQQVSLDGRVIDAFDADRVLMGDLKL